MVDRQSRIAIDGFDNAALRIAIEIEGTPS
jgi:hypothetical protein